MAIHSSHAPMLTRPSAQAHQRSPSESRPACSPSAGSARPVPRRALRTTAPGARVDRRRPGCRRAARTRPPVADHPEQGRSAGPSTPQPAPAAAGRGDPHARHHPMGPHAPRNGEPCSPLRIPLLGTGPSAARLGNDCSTGGVLVERRIRGAAVHPPTRWASAHAQHLGREVVDPAGFRDDWRSGTWT
jgi:hypothetical protein